jgi:O-antigen/teichoic acid export membrane protein
VVIGIFDLGLSSVLGRELARDTEDDVGRSHKSRLLTTFEALAWAIAASLLVLAMLASAYGGIKWMKSSSIEPEIVHRCLTLIVVALALQFPSLLYTGGMAGLQRHRELNYIQISMNLMRWGGGATLAILGLPLTIFFVFQSGVSLVQSAVLRARVWNQFDRSGTHRFSADLLLQHLAFAGAMAGTSICAVLISNVDRIIVSQFLTMADLGKYAIAFMACGTVQMLVLPFYRVFYPRYSSAVFAGDLADLRSIYMDSTRWLSTLVVPVIVCMWAFSTETLTVWLGDIHPESIAIMRFLLLGVGMAALGWLPGALQQAHGDASLHLCMLVLALLIGIPVSLWAISLFGAVGATAVWLVHGLLCVFVEPYLMHRKYLRTELLHWYTKALFIPLLASAVIVYPARMVFPHDAGRWQTLIYLLAIGTLTLTSSHVAQRIFKTVGGRDR